jgi:peptidoglycan biosynthesis protein MviN/MurJ (putative lipid II flippase)
VFGLGHAGLALSTSIVALWNSALLFHLLQSRTGGGTLGLGRELGRIVAATAVMGGACWLWLGRVGGVGFFPDLTRVATTVPLGAVTFYAAGRVLGLEDLEKFGDLVKRGLDAAGRRLLQS